MTFTKHDNGVNNIDARTVSGFGDEWTRFTQAELDQSQKQQIFDDYFRIFPWHLLLPNGGTGADIGCGSGRWAMVVAPRVAMLHLLDASREALEVAKNNLKGIGNVQFHHASVGDIPLADESLDFAYSLGVLHHVPDTQRAVEAIARKLRSGAPFLLYLYYAFDNRPIWYRLLWKMTNRVRLLVSKLPYLLKYFVTQLIAVGVYWPLARMAKLLDLIGCLPNSWPLSYYRDKSFYTIRTDAFDRFGTSLEKRFSRNEILEMMGKAGFEKIRFSDSAPYWCAVGIKKRAKMYRENKKSENRHL